VELIFVTDVEKIRFF